jgi:hypothetical protein
MMISGAFRRMLHEHDFVEHPTGTLMRDRFEFGSPLGFLGRVADRLFVTSYMRRFLVRRNEMLKRLAESAEWSRYLETAGRFRAACQQQLMPRMILHTNK